MKSLAVGEDPRQTRFSVLSPVLEVLPRRQQHPPGYGWCGPRSEIQNDSVLRLAPDFLTVGKSIAGGVPLAPRLHPFADGTDDRRGGVPAEGAHVRDVHVHVLVAVKVPEPGSRPA